MNNRSSKRRKIQEPSSRQSKLHHFFKTPAQSNDALLSKLASSQNTLNQTRLLNTQTQASPKILPNFSLRFAKHDLVGGYPNTTYYYGASQSARDAQQQQQHTSLNLDVTDDFSPLQFIPTTDLNEPRVHFDDHLDLLSTSGKVDTDEVFKRPSIPNNKIAESTSRRKHRSSSEEEFSFGDINSLPCSEVIGAKQVNADTLRTLDVCSLECSPVIGRKSNIRNNTNHVGEIVTKNYSTFSELNSLDIESLPCSVVIKSSCCTENVTGDTEGDSRAEFNTCDIHSLTCSMVIGCSRDDVANTCNMDIRDVTDSSINRDVTNSSINRDVTDEPKSISYSTAKSFCVTPECSELPHYGDSQPTLQPTSTFHENQSTNPSPLSPEMNCPFKLFQDASDSEDELVSEPDNNNMSQRCEMASEDQDLTTIVDSAKGLECSNHIIDSQDNSVYSVDSSPDSFHTPAVMRGYNSIMGL